MAVVKREFVDGTYGQIHLRIAQPENPVKRPLVCLHMFPQSGRNFEHFLPVVSDDRIVVAPDFPGYGESDAPETPIDASAYAATIWEVVEALSLDKSFGEIDIFGIHAGSKLAVEASFQRPQSVNRIFLSSSAILSDEEVAGLRSAFKPVSLDTEGTRFKNLWKLQVENRGPNMSLEMMATGLAEMLRTGEKMEWGHYAVFDYNIIFPERINALPHPIALLNPGDDLYEMTPRTLPYLKNGQLFDKPEWSHGFLEANAEELASLVDSFLSESVEFKKSETNAASETRI